MKNDLYHNGSEARDPVAGKAIQKADKPPEQVEAAIRRMKTVARWHGLEVAQRIVLRDPKTGRVWT